MGNSFSQNRVDGFPTNEIVQLLICGHDCICLRVGFKKRNIIFILCSIVIGTSYVMGSDKLVEELKLKLQASERHNIELVQQLEAKNQIITNKQRSINQLTTSLRQGIHSVRTNESPNKTNGQF